MSTAKNYLIVLLALTTVAGAALSWRQYKELVGLRAAADDRADLQKRIWDLQKANRELNDRLAAERSTRPEGTDEVASDGDAKNQPADAGPGRRGFGPRAQQFAAMREAMQKPEVQALLSAAQKSLIESRYAPLFKSLNLTQDQQDKLAGLLADRQNAFRDVAQAARDQGVDPRTDPDGFQKLLDDSRNAIDASIKSVIGDNGYSQLTNYDQTMPQRNLVNVLQQRLAYSDAPLTSAQSDQLIQILATNAPANTNATGNEGWGRGPNNAGGDFGGGFAGRIGGAMMGGMGGGVGAITAAPITPQAVSQASGVLNPTQVTALQQLQQQQQTAEQLQQVIRSTWQQASAASGQTGNGSAGQPAEGATPPPPGNRRPGR